jgi:DNA invertase Pin-like site-specific DNA recombinase
VIDDDLGRSGATVEGRPGFQRLVAEVGLDHVGIVLGIEMSRLARSCRDWHQLLEVCAIFGTLIGDIDGVYDPGVFNDRLLLGLKGTMSEAELYVIKQRMLQGKIAKARRGELGMQLPMGYVRHPSGEFIKDPDEQAQKTIALVFQLFERYGTLHGILRYLVDHDIRMPRRLNTGERKGELEWRRPNRVTLSNMLHNPIYAGAYVYGRRPTDPRKKKPGRPSTGRTIAKPGEWQVFLRDKLPAYITWDQYEKNLRQLESNTANAKGVVRHGPSILSGLLKCGRCGRRMTVSYTNNGNKLRYACMREMVDYGGPLCQSLKGKPLDKLISDYVLRALEPAALEISLKVAEDVESEQMRLRELWEKRLERARYETERAFRQYNSVEPENRLVARTLERKWEETLESEEELKKEYARFLTSEPTTLSEEHRDAIRSLASDIPTLWHAETTKPEERQTIVRQLIDQVVVTVIGESEKVEVQINWAGGHQSQTTLIRPVARLEQLSYYKELCQKVAELHSKGMKSAAIAHQLTKEGWRPPKRRKTFNGFSVSTILSRLGLTNARYSRTKERSQEKNLWSLNELAQKLDMPSITLYSWLKKGQLDAYQDTSHPYKIWTIRADEKEIERLRALRAKPKKWSRHVRVN